MSRSHLRGAGFLTRLLSRAGMLNVIAQYQLGRVKFCVPLWRIPWDDLDVANYEVRFIDAFCNSLTSLEGAILFDCGADIGTFSALVCYRTDRIGRIVAFEPNPATQEFLKTNLVNAGVPFVLIPKAVSNFEGIGRLERPAANNTDHARFLVAGQGPIDVTTIDSSRVRSGDVAIKLDIEGGELDALEGARETIRSSRKCVIGLEANPEVTERTRRDPIECLRFLDSIRPFRFLVAETGDHPSLANPVLREGQSEIWNIVAWTI